MVAGVPTGFGVGALAALALIPRIPLALAVISVTVLSLGYDMTQPLLAGIVTSLSKRPGQAMGLNVFLLFTGFGVGSIAFGEALRFGVAWALGAFCVLQVAASLLAFSLFRTEVAGAPV